ncbi:hypothetical protein BDZ97DRAFT_111812 [Flammula alnicola]|nr:hypothetical protein BDZ97DRAFT_111812 [Flammula alnicola]
MSTGTPGVVQYAVLTEKHPLVPTPTLRLHFQRWAMIVLDNSDAASTNTLVTSEKIPRYFVKLTYASLVFSILPFIFALINVLLSPIFAIPTILAYVFTSPFHVAAILVVWQHARQNDSALPFEPSSGRSISYTCFLAAMWIFSSITCGIGIPRFQPPYCPDLGCSSNDYNKSAKTRTTFVVSTVLSTCEVMIMGAIILVCYLNRPRKVPSPPPTSASSSDPKVVSA